MNNPLDRIADLIKRTGDTVVVLDSAGQPAYVILAFDKYEQSVGLPPAAAKPSSRRFEEYHSGKDVDNHVDSVSHWEPPHAEFEPMISKDSLNTEKNNQKEESQEEKYYFEPIS